MLLVAVINDVCAMLYGGIMGGATTFACKSQGCRWTALVYFIWILLFDNAWRVIAILIEAFELVRNHFFEVVISYAWCCHGNLKIMNFPWSVCQMEYDKLFREMFDYFKSWVIILYTYMFKMTYIDILGVVSHRHSQNALIFFGGGHVWKKNVRKVWPIDKKIKVKNIFRTSFLSPPVHTAWWAHVHRFLSVCLSVCVS